MLTYVPNIVEANGKTIKENNLAQGHAIPLGALVEVNLDYSEEHGIRMYVCEHSRDCDGTPLYTLWPSKAIGDYDPNPKGTLEHIQIQQAYNMKASTGWSDSCLIVIKLPE